MRGRNSVFLSHAPIITGFPCRDILRPLCEKAGIRISRFIQAPIEGLCAYHTE